VVEKVLPADEMVMVRSRMPGSVAMATCCSSVVDEVLVDLVGHREEVVLLADRSDLLQLGRG
jgi:hypothetical protein